MEDLKPACSSSEYQDIKSYFLVHSLLNIEQILFSGQCSMIFHNLKKRTIDVVDPVSDSVASSTKGTFYWLLAKGNQANLTGFLLVIISICSKNLFCMISTMWYTTTCFLWQFWHCQKDGHVTQGLLMLLQQTLSCLQWYCSNFWKVTCHFYTFCIILPMLY